MQLPGRGEITAILIGIRIADHHLLPAGCGEQLFDQGRLKVAGHRRRGGAQVGDGLEQGFGEDFRGRRLARRKQPDLLEQKIDFQKIGDRGGVRDNVGADRLGAVAADDFGGGGQYLKLPAGFGAVGGEG